MTASAFSVSRWPALQLDDRSLGAIKWLALVLMIVDHVNTLLLDGSHAWMYVLGRIAMPLFALVLGFNLARPGALVAGAYRRAVQRLLVFGLLATPAFVAVHDFPSGWWPLNMMFGLLVSVVAMWLLDLGGARNVFAAVFVVAVGGALVEFFWSAVVLCLSVWAYRRHPSAWPAFGLFFALAALMLVNGNAWAFAAPAVVLLASYWRFNLPRGRLFFYGFYPAHFWLIWAYLALVR
ncbi:MAG: conjugal transfer protein TraX [Polaromonas sp.]|nr:conjugal transfer protein TraX [Polaromonas sp.]